MMINEFRRYIPLLLTELLVLGACAFSEAHADTPLDFNRDVRPILSDYCFHCHGPADASREVDLRFDERDNAVAAGAIVPGDPSNSELVSRIMSEDHDLLMPPPESKKELSTEQKQTLIEWIKQGAKYDQHWAFAAPVSPALPAVEQGDWVTNPIDQFVLARLEAEGIQPTPQADRATLIRRVAFDLTGLPPSLEELDRFLALESENWYEQMVDHYFSQPAYGERMALPWLDASRFGDSSVFHADGHRDMWPWRDWVINAYNSNLPFDQFTIEQLAGDLLPNATPEQKIASGFNRNHATTDEGGVIAEEWRVDYVVDRVQTTSNVWLGLTMECSQCHSHKYDPISQKEYYGFFAFFNQTTDPGMQTRNGNQAPVVNVPNPDLDGRIAQTEEQISSTGKQLEEHKTNSESAFQEWLTAASQAAQSSEQPQLAQDYSAYIPLNETEGTSVNNVVPDAPAGTVTGNALWQPGHNGNAFQVDGSNFIAFPDTGNFDNAETVSFGCWVKSTGTPNGAAIAKMDEGNAHRGWDMLIQNGQLAVHIINAWPGNAIKITTKGKIPADQWTHLWATYDGSGKAAGLKIYFNGELQDVAVNNDNLTATTISEVPLKIGRRHNSGFFKGLVDEVRMYARVLGESEIRALAGTDPIRPLLLTQKDERTPEQLQTLRDHYFAAIDETHQKLVQSRAELQQQLDGMKKQIVTSMIMGEQDKPRETYLLMRGHYASPDKSEVIKPDVPKVLPPLPEGAPRNRLGLAQWLVSPEHPLTSRVTVNRYWTMLFGQGLVTTPMDFGTQGAWPTHPELLDWLAVDFREQGWDIKRTLKQILMSSTYRQSSVISPQLQKKDPLNELLARGARFRLQGEIIRDTALFASGILNEQVGGPGVKPYQPPGLWNEVALSANVRFVQDEGEKLFRKSMYIYWKRSAPHPGMRIFDAPTREKCVVARPRTNTPLQALYAMNDVQFVEAARELAARMMREGGDTPQEKIAFAYRILTAHEPSASTLAALENLYIEQQKKYLENDAAATALLDVGDLPRDDTLELSEHAAWTVVANVLLNMDAALTKF